MLKFDQTISKAFNFTKNHPFLWILSFLAILGGVAYENQAQFSVNIPSNILSKIPFNTLENYSHNFLNNLSSYLPVILISFSIILILFLALFVIGLIAKSGQIDSILKLDNNKKTDFYTAFSLGKKFAWRIFLLKLLYSITIFISVIISIPLVLITFIFFFITIPLLWVYYGALSILYKNTEIILIKNNYGIFKSIKESWKLIIEEWKNIGLLWLISFGLRLAVMFVFFAIGILIFIFAVFVGIGIGYLIVSSQISILIPIAFTVLAILILITILVSIFINSILHTFFTSYWIVGINSLAK